MKLTIYWNSYFFLFRNKPQRTELFSAERAKDHQWEFSKIRNDVCVAILGKRGYIDRKIFDEDED